MWEDGEKIAIKGRRKDNIVPRGPAKAVHSIMVKERIENNRKVENKLKPRADTPLGSDYTAVYTRSLFMLSDQ